MLKKILSEKWMAVVLICVAVFTVYMFGMLIREANRCVKNKDELAVAESMYEDEIVRQENIKRLLALKNTDYFLKMVERENGMISDTERVFIIDK